MRAAAALLVLSGLAAIPADAQWFTFSTTYHDISTGDQLTELLHNEIAEARINVALSNMPLGARFGAYIFYVTIDGGIPVLNYNDTDADRPAGQLQQLTDATNAPGPDGGSTAWIGGRRPGSDLGDGNITPGLRGLVPLGDAPNNVSNYLINSIGWITSRENDGDTPAIVAGQLPPPELIPSGSTIFKFRIQAPSGGTGTISCTAIPGLVGDPFVAFYYSRDGVPGIAGVMLGEDSIDYIPAPPTLALLSLASLLAVRRRR